MEPHHRRKLFDSWAEGYDSSLQSVNDFPFKGYEQVLDEIVRTAQVESGMKVLDLGIGTGNLAARFTNLGCDIYGIDFSRQMLLKARQRLPQAGLIQTALLDEWPLKTDMRFDRIVSGYVLHEFDLPTKVKLLRRLAQHYLFTEGRIIVGDIAFPTSQARERAREKWADLWDEKKYYWAAEEAIVECTNTGLKVTYNQISSCGGVFVIWSDHDGK